MDVFDYRVKSVRVADVLIVARARLPEAMLGLTVVWKTEIL